MNLNELRDRAYKNAVTHGWHVEDKSHCHWLCLVISELMEAVEADRKDNHAEKEYYEKRISNSLVCKGLHPSIPKEKGLAVAFRDFIKDSVEDELADACIRILDYCGTINFTIDDSCADDEIIEEFSRVFKDKTFTGFIFNIVTSLTRFEIQIAFLKILGLSNINRIDIFLHIEQKMKYNELRSYKHGNKSY